jgi:acetyltransferase-like isoleucine patch superfamily enzyme
VTKDIAESGIYIGNPARLLRRLPVRNNTPVKTADVLAGL